MDPRRFDTLVRRLTTGSSRRHLLGVLSALPLVGPALAASDEATAAKHKSRGKHKRRGAQHDPGPAATSCAKRCRKKASKQARRRCRKGCQTPPECTTNADCPAGELCEDGRCIPIPDQCGADTDCDACERCAGGVCVAQCQPDEVCRNGQCASVECTADRKCGDCSRCVDGRCRWQCAVTEVCLSGAGGRCCQPRGCPAGTNCGTVADGCGGTVRCGSCTAPETCGGSGLPNQCGCTPTTCAAQGAQCDSIGDGCGRTLDCGTCPPAPTICLRSRCEANRCVLLPANNGAPCDDGDACTTGSTCLNGTCGGGTPISCTTPQVCQTTVGATCDPNSGTCTYPALANGTTCGTQSEAGGGAIHCCHGTCPDPDCLPAGQLCPEQNFSSCDAACCTKSGTFRGDQYLCSQSGTNLNRSCGSDTDCSFGLCQCGVCCVASGAPVNSLGCAACCSKTCNGSVCA